MKKALLAAAALGIGALLVTGGTAMATVHPGPPPAPGPEPSISVQPDGVRWQGSPSPSASPEPTVSTGGYYNGGGCPIGALVVC